MNHSIFALELCLCPPAGNPLAMQLGELVRRHPATTTPGAKWEMYRAARQLLANNLGYAVSGCWDFFDSDAKSLADYDMWTKGMTTEEGSRRSPRPDASANNMYRQQSEAAYITCTMSFLLQNGSFAERQLNNQCNIPDDRLWTRATFAHLLDKIGLLSFAVVKSDVFYVIPGDDRWALTADDMRDPKFEYLRPIVG